MPLSLFHVAGAFLLGAFGVYFGGKTEVGQSKLPKIGTVTKTPVELFFDCFNKRDLNGAAAYFADNAEYEDIIAGKFIGRQAIKEHLTANANSVPPSAKLIIDKVANDLSSRNIGVTWHVEIDGAVGPLSGCNLYTVNKDGLVVYGKSVHP